MLRVKKSTMKLNECTLKCIYVFIHLHLESPFKFKERDFHDPQPNFGIEAIHPHHIRTSSKLSTLLKYWIKDSHETVSLSPLIVNFKWSFVVKNFLNCQQSIPGRSTLFTKIPLHFPFSLWHQWDKYLWTLQDKALNIFKKYTPRCDMAEEKDCLSADPVTLCCHTGKKWYVATGLEKVSFHSNPNHKLPDIQAGFRKGRGTRD